MKTSRGGSRETAARQDMRVAEIRVLSVGMGRNAQIGVYAQVSLG